MFTRSIKRYFINYLIYYFKLLINSFIHSITYYYFIIYFGFIDSSLQLKHFFHSNNYDFIYTCYGNKIFNNFGIAIAFPTLHYNLIDGNISKVCDTKHFYSSSEKNDDNISNLNDLNSIVIDPIQNIDNTSNLNEISSLGLDRESSISSIWSDVNNRPNEMITIQLEPKSSSLNSSNSSNQPFYIATYHMPCVYYNPAIMAIHCSLATQQLQRLAKSSPYIFAGDFNITPNDILYQLLTTGNIIQSNEKDYNPLNTNDWKLQFEPMRSCYSVYLGKEPEYTNNTLNKTMKFINTLDYIFISSHWNVTNVLNIPSLQSLDIHYPNENEPSDHVMIAAELELKDTLV